jgi:peptidyl-prolyl cis-trans isomerase C
MAIPSRPDNVSPSGRISVHLRVVSYENAVEAPDPGLPTSVEPFKIMIMKSSLLQRGLVAALALIFGAANAQEQPTAPAQDASKEIAPTENPVILTVDGTPIMAEDVREMMMARYGQQLAQMAQQAPEQLAMIQQQVQGVIIQDLVRKTLLLNAAEAEGFKASEEAVNKSLAEIEDRLPEGSSLEEFAASGGVPITRIKKQIQEDTKIRQLVDQVTADVSEPAKAEVKKYYDENPDEFAKQESVAASHILVSTQGITDDTELAAKLESAQNIKKQLDEGATFEELAAQHSDCPSKQNGGSLGDFGRGQMVPEFEKAAFEQEVGKVGDLVKTDFGYHIIKVTQKQESKEMAFVDVQKELTSSLFEQAKAKKVEEYITELEGKAKIEQSGAPEAPKASGKEEIDAAKKG